MMKLVLLGYGKMGQAVEQEARQRGHEIVDRIDQGDLDRLGQLGPEQADAVIEFTHPNSFRDNLQRVMDRGLPLISGTTGWYAQMEEVQRVVAAAKGSFLYASNFSVGVNLLFELNRKLAALMNGYPDYDPFVEEHHHRHKADAPSGTAHTLAQDLIAGLDRKTRVSDAQLRQRAPEPEELSVSYTRAGEIIGLHSVTYRSEIDRISITHEAYNRRGFALGAVIGAEWLQGKSGFHEFRELFQ